MTECYKTPAKQLDDRMPQKPLLNSLTEAHHVSTLPDQPPSSFDGQVLSNSTNCLVAKQLDDRTIQID